MTDTTTTTGRVPPGVVLLTEPMKVAAALVREHGVMDPDDPTRKFEVNRTSWRLVYEMFHMEIPDVLTGFIDGQPVINGTTKTGARKRQSYQSVAKPNPDDDGTTITCTGPCGERQPIKKYPTLKGGGRGSVCRACEAIIRAERKAGRG